METRFSNVADKHWLQRGMGTRGGERPCLDGSWALEMFPLEYKASSPSLYDTAVLLTPTPESTLPFTSVWGAAYLLCDLGQEPLPLSALISHLFCGTHRVDLKLKGVTTYSQGTWYTAGAQSRPQPTLVTLPQALG